MQLDIEADDQLIASVKDTAKLETRNERVYDVDVPAGTDKLTITSVGGNTKNRACMQELYLLTLRKVTPPTPTNTNSIPDSAPVNVRKLLIDGHIYIEREGIIYNIDGRPALP
jgi:hypothetical protein